MIDELLARGVMALAYELATESKDPSTQTSAILVGSYGEIVGRAVNHFPWGVSPDHWHGPKEAKYARVVHAEVGAILHAARYGKTTSGTVMVAPWAACSNCAKHIADAGITTLYRHAFLDNGVTEDNPWYQDCLVGDEIMRESGIHIVDIPPVPTEVRIRRNGELWP